METKNQAHVGVPLGEAKVGKVVPVTDSRPIVAVGRKKPVLRRKKEQLEDAGPETELDIKLAGDVQTLSIKDGDLLVVNVKADLPPSAAQQVSNAVRDRFNKLIADMNASAVVQVFITKPSESIEFSIVRKEDQAVMDSAEQFEEAQAAAGSTLDALEKDDVG